MIVYLIARLQHFFQMNKIFTAENLRLPIIYAGGWPVKTSVDQCRQSPPLLRETRWPWMAVSTFFSVSSLRKRTFCHSIELSLVLVHSLLRCLGASDTFIIFLAFLSRQIMPIVNLTYNPVLYLYLLLGSLLYKIQKEQEMFVKIVSAFRWCSSFKGFHN